MKVTWVVVVALASTLWGQDVPRAPEKKVLSGCVTRSEAAATLVLHSETSCTRVLGKVAAEKVAGHVVTLEGILTPATQTDPETMRVSTVKSVGEACSATCTLEPPGKRGLRKKERPAGDASTPGAQPTTPKPGQNGPTR